jgi:Fic family protein
LKLLSVTYPQINLLPSESGSQNLIRNPETAEACATTKPTVKCAIEDLQQLGIVTEATGKTRNKVYIYNEYLDILNQDDDTFEAQ